MRSPALRAVLFDFDGTLAPSLPLWVKAYHIALAKFGITISDDDVMNYKPHPEPVLTTLRALECDPLSAIMIGDSHADILAGKSAGTRTALFMPDDHHVFHDGARLRATNPDFIFSDHEELPALLGLPRLVACTS